MQGDFISMLDISCVTLWVLSPSRPVPRGPTLDLGRSARGHQEQTHRPTKPGFDPVSDIGGVVGITNMDSFPRVWGKVEFPLNLSESRF